MNKLNITEKDLQTKYLAVIDTICDINENKTTFTGEEVCSIVCNIINKDTKTGLRPKELYRLYSKKIKSLNVTDEQWRTNYGIPEIIGVIYKILEDGN